MLLDSPGTFKEKTSVSRSLWRSQYERIFKNIKNDSQTEVTLTLAKCICIYIYIYICMERKEDERERRGEKEEEERILKSN